MQPRILIVEDENIVAMDLAVTLRRLGYDVIGTENNGISAIQSAAAAKPDLVLMDIRLKGAMDGIEAGTTIQRDLGIPVVFLTAHGDADTVQRTKAASPYGYLVKPFDERLLYRAVEVALNLATRDEAERRSLEAQLIQAQRLESMAHLAGGVAHDFNNMLMVIFARCELLLRSLDSPKHRQLVHDIMTAAKRNRDLTQQLLAAARQQVLEPEVIDVNEIVRSVVGLLARALGENIVIRSELHDDLWNAHADASKLTQVLMNLAINARDAMPSGGTLLVETRNVQIDRNYARHHIGVRPGDYLSIVVSDTGTGIPKELQDRIFDPFFTTKEAGRGTGLGLAVVRGIVEQTGGHIWMYSEPGLGTTFKIFLPRYEGTAAKEGAPLEVAMERGSGTILLVEDEPLLATIVEEALTEQGYTVVTAPGPAEALAISAAHPEPIHLLLTDVIMPGMPGNELAALIVEQRPDTRVIFMSGYTNQALANASSVLQGARVLEKPVATSVLLRTIAEVLNGREAHRR
jgi:two-component system cell cycle sensor histidine kinase/response regulator CckA